MRRVLVFAAAGAAALLFAAAARATAYAPDAARTAARLPREQREERGFLRSMAAQARFEAEACRLAQARAQGAGPRAWAAELLRQHELAHAELVYLLHARGMALPMLENDQRKALARLSRLAGAKFDREFMELVQPRQRARLQHFEQAQAAVADPALRGWIERQLPGLRKQVAAAERVGPDGRTGLASRGGLRPSLVSGSSTR